MGRQRRVGLVLLIGLIVASAALVSGHKTSTGLSDNSSQAISSPASAALDKLAVKPSASLAGYNRNAFGDGWASVGGCDMREHILGRDLSQVKLRSVSDCTVLSGTLDDPYTGKTIHFVRGAGTSAAVQIDHVVALGDAWQTGAQSLSSATRIQLYNDPLELLAVDGPANEQKSDADASVWLPPNKSYDCRYVARQIAVKLKYHLWVTADEHNAMADVLGTCPSQALPAVN